MRLFGIKTTGITFHFIVGQLIDYNSRVVKKYTPNYGLVFLSKVYKDYFIHFYKNIAYPAVEAGGFIFLRFTSEGS